MKQFLILCILAAAVCGCESAPKMAENAASSQKQTVTLADENKSHVIDPSVRDMLAELEKGHSDKIQLAWFASLPFKKLTPDVKEFAAQMGKDHKALRERLNAWAKKNDVSLKFSFGNDLFGKARKDLEKSQGNEVEVDGGDDFQRDFLILMSVDYLTQRSYIRTLLKQTVDPELTAYLNDSLAIHERDRAAIRTFLKHYKYEENAK